MQKIGLLISGTIYILFILVVGGCEEVGPTIDLTDVAVDSTYVDPNSSVSPQSKVVLMEEFTGVKCVNCPEGHKKLSALLTKYGERLVAVSIHSGIFAIPIKNLSKQDFKTSKGEAIEALLGAAEGWPAASIDRKLYPTESALILFMPQWDSYVGERLLLTTPANLDMTKKYYDETRELAVNVEVRYTQAVSDTHNLTIYIIENDIVEAQETETGIDSNYVHQHTLREVITPVNGVNLGSGMEKGRVYIKGFSLKVNPLWKVENCKIIAAVHKIGKGLDVVQAVEVKLK